MSDIDHEDEFDKAFEGFGEDPAPVTPPAADPPQDDPVQEDGGKDDTDLSRASQFFFEKQSTEQHGYKRIYEITETGLQNLTIFDWPDERIPVDGDQDSRNAKISKGFPWGESGPYFPGVFQNQRRRKQKNDRPDNPVSENFGGRNFCYGLKVDWPQSPGGISQNAV